MGKHGRSLSGCGLAGLGLVVLVCGTARADDVKKIQGHWKVVSAEVGPNEATKAQLKDFRVIVDGNKFTLKEGSRSYVVHFILDPDAKPSGVEFFKDAGKKDKVWHGIYDFEGKDLKLCWGPAGEPRPARFGTNKKNENRYYVIRKE